MVSSSALWRIHDFPSRRSGDIRDWTDWLGLSEMVVGELAKREEKNGKGGLIKNLTKGPSC